MKITQRLWQHHLGQKRFSGDLFDPGALALIVTNRCNFSCRHCMRQSATTDDLSLETAEKILRGAKVYGFTHVAITGGEPLVYPHLKQLVEKIVAHGYTFNLVTNGFLFERWVAFFKTQRQQTQGIAFSVESAQPEHHDAIRHPGSFAKLCDAFSSCRQNKIPFTVTTAISQANYHEIFDIALLAKKKGARFLAATTILPCPHAEQNKLVLDPEKREKLAGALTSLSHSLRLPIRISADIRGQRNLRICRALHMYEIAVDAKGQLVQCCELANYADPDICRRAVIDDLNTQDFPQALKNLVGHIDRFMQGRIDAYGRQKDARNDSVDFNSCFYCLRHLKQ